MTMQSSNYRFLLRRQTHLYEEKTSDSEEPMQTLGFEISGLISQGRVLNGYESSALGQLIEMHPSNYNKPGAIADFSEYLFKEERQGCLKKNVKDD
ncbi:10414_t:CDS:2 [Paraglomus brasilianum]|uniref:10414_t:CDS:1 n=1 Tax=Paraglomus brasilianum TaxID=144538 RepID=A0A9N8ZM66_9GLOM|nr:10414_t:CDS:2 [Paraglomus brasilianum]